MSELDLLKNAIALATYQSGVKMKKTVDESCTLRKGVHSPENWSYDDGDVIYSTMQFYKSINTCNL